MQILTLFRYWKVRIIHNPTSHYINIHNFVIIHDMNPRFNLFDRYAQDYGGV